ncbi:hypothetical protein [Ferruginibacter sp. HRS2-29]|uniref:hypothetical protein n=1 Tax=Ferruginibacter sp. HRS2-29 TaxID=2487334 RepID=UPI0020CCC350|nr:hypothetical protein [Ferruginibacter sp. HRS2-29]MCP9753253.1 hypothetical protein [Ferruginibacter sp. HRS2-29]
MFATKLKKSIAKGDFVTLEEAVFDREADLVSRCETAVNMVIKKVLTLQEALEAYELSFEQYSDYIMLNSKGAGKRNPYIKEK